MSRRLARFLEHEASEFWLCLLSVQERRFQWRHQKLPAPDPAEWLAEATAGYRAVQVTLLAPWFDWVQLVHDGDRSRCPAP